MRRVYLDRRIRNKLDKIGFNHEFLIEMGMPLWVYEEWGDDFKVWGSILDLNIEDSLSIAKIAIKRKMKNEKT